MSCGCLCSEIRIKSFREGGENKSKLSYTQSQYYFFDGNSSGSGLSESDIICTINIPIMVVKGPKVHILSLVSGILQVGVYTVLDTPAFEDIFKYIMNATSAQLYTCQNVSGLVWGYTDDFLQKLYDLGVSPVNVRLILHS